VSRAPETSRAAYRAALAAFGGDGVVQKYLDVDESHKVDILSCKDRPSPGLVSYSTLGVHLVSNVIQGKDVRIELAGVGGQSIKDFPNLLSTAAFYVVKDRWKCRPGVVYMDLLKMYKLSETLEHLMWVEPFEWESLSSVDVAGLTIHWLLGIPISDSEDQYLRRNGFEKLERLFVDREIDYWDLNRQPVV